MPEETEERDCRATARNFTMRETPFCVGLYGGCSWLSQRLPAKVLKVKILSYIVSVTSIIEMATVKTRLERTPIVFY